MKYSKTILFSLLIISLLMPLVAFAHAAKTPSYVGIKEDQTYSWTTEFDPGPIEDFLEAIGYTEELAEVAAYNVFESLDWEEEVVEWRLTIHNIRKETEEGIIEPDESLNDEYEFVKYVYSLKEYDGDAGWWRTMESYQTAKIWEPDEELWAKMFFSDTYGLDSDTKRAEIDYPPLIVPKNLDWDQVARERSDRYKYSSMQEEYIIEEVEIQYFLSKKEVGIHTERDPSYIFPQYEKDLDILESFSKYNDDGVLYYYEYTYDGDIIAKFELKGVFGPYFIENWWWMAIVAGAVVVGVIIVIVVLVKIVKKRSK